MRSAGDKDEPAGVPMLPHGGDLANGGSSSGAGGELAVERTIADEVAAHGGRGERAPGLLRVILPRDRETDRQDDLLPHRLHAGNADDGEGLVEAPHRRR